MPKKIILEQTPPHLSLFHGSFGPMSPRLRSFPIIGFDSEDNTKGTPISFAFHTGTTHFYTRHVDEAIDYIYNTESTSIFVAHNLEYDLGNLFNHCNYKYVKEMIYASRLLKCTLFGSSHVFLNSSSFFAGSLASMGKIVGVKKLDGDPFNAEYNIQDAKIVQVFMSRLQDRLHDQGVNLGLSIGQLAMSVYRANYMRQKRVTYNSPNVLKAYYGGRVEMFYKGVVYDQVHVLDINSSYPDVMRRFEYPDTSYLEESSIYTHRFGVGHFKLRVPGDCFIPPLPFRSDGQRLFFPVGQIDGWWTYAEVRYAVERLGCSILEEFSGEGTNRACRPFADFIDSFYEQRQAQKRRLKLNPEDTEAEFESLFLKLLMNNLYGKFAQHKASTKMTRVRLSENELAKLQGYIEHKRGPFYAYTIPKNKPPRTANYLWGVYVTSYARLSLLEKLLMVHDSGGQLIYCDTDSIMFSRREGCNMEVTPLKIAGLEVGDGLGKMSAEVFDLGIFRAAKGYLLCNRRSTGLKDRKPEYVIEKVACKGVPTHLAQEFIIKGMATALKPMRLKEAQVRLTAKSNSKKDEAFFKDVGVNVWREVTKWMRSVYIKRKGAKGITYPVDVSEIPALEENAGEDVLSIEEDLPAARFTSAKKKNTAFENIVIPPDWFKREPKDEVVHAYFASQQVQFMRREACLDLNPGDSWFKGEIMEMRVSQYGRYYLFFLKTYLGENVARKNILGAISIKYFNEKNILQKTVEFFMEAKYTYKTSLKVRVEIT